MKTIKACGYCQYYSDKFCAVNPNFLGNAENCADWEEDNENLKDLFQKNDWIEEWAKQAYISYHGSGDEAYLVDWGRCIATFQHRNCQDYGELPIPSQNFFKEFLRYQNVEFLGEGIYLEKPSFNRFCTVHILGDSDSPFVYKNEKDARLFVSLIQKLTCEV